MYTTCTFYNAHCTMHTQFSPHLSKIYTKCTLHLHHIHTTFTPHVNNPIYSICTEYTTFTPHLPHICSSFKPHFHQMYTTCTLYNVHPICTTFTPHLHLHLAASTVLDVSLNLTSSMLSVTFIKLVVSLLAKSWKARFLKLEGWQLSLLAWWLSPCLQTLLCLGQRSCLASRQPVDLMLFPCCSTESWEMQYRRDIS